MNNTAVTAAYARIRAHLERGAPWDACDAFRESAPKFADDAEYIFLGALAHARVGATHESEVLLKRARAATQDAALLTEILSLSGRLWKDRFDRARDRAGAPELAQRARTDYLAAYALQHDPFPGINAATLSMLLDEPAAARDLAREILSRLAAKASPWNSWDHATAGEAELLLSRADRAAEHYATAYAQAPGGAGGVASMRRQLNLLARAIPEARDILTLLPAPDVLAFAGHMIDANDRPEPRFPAALEPAVAAALREHLARLHAPILYTSAACGADLICLEQALDLGAEVNVVLPFDRDDFVRTSVATGGEGWVARFDQALSRAARVIMATVEGHLDDDVLYEHAAKLVEGFTMLRAAQLQTSAELLCVIDAGAPGDVGGTALSLERWQRQAGLVRVIDLRELRARAALDESGSAPKVRAAPSLAAAPITPAIAVPASRSRMQRSIKSMLFADFAGYSRLHDAYAPLFQSQFLEIGAEAIEAAPVKPLEAKTWGDGMYLVFESQGDAAEFALRLLESMLAVDWTAVELPESSQIRIALHAGPVFCGFDPVMGRDSFFGADVTRAARIEPITPPGMVYVSEAFAATLAATGQDRYALEYVGRLALAKGYGESRIYRLERC
jgi:hypothetical protein